MYPLIRPLLFLLPPERAHRFTFWMLERMHRLPLLRNLFVGTAPDANSKVTVMGIDFPSAVGLAAGLDKNAEHVDALSSLGFGFIEIGTLTPLPQPGNDPPRLFRLPEDRALINRMGFNNGGVVAAVERLHKRRPGIIIGGNIGKNKDTPNADAARDYETCFRALHPVVDYFVVNVSSPNTPGLRELQDKGPLRELLIQLRSIGSALGEKPILLKIAPDLNDEQLDDICAVVRDSGIQGVVATNTSIAREGLRTPSTEVDALGAGGLSGVPLRKRSTEVVRYLRERLPRPFVIIGVGGIENAESAMDKFAAGADLVQVYTGLIYKGPALVGRIDQAYAQWKSRR